MTWLRALATWLVLIGAEILHGIARSVVLTPKVGDVRARQIGVYTGTGMNLGIAGLFVRWIGTRTVPSLVGIGIVWVVLTVGFELAFGRWVARASWARLRSDYDLAHWRLLPLGLAASPILAARLRGVRRDARD